MVEKAPIKPINNIPTPPSRDLVYKKESGKNERLNTQRRKITDEDRKEKLRKSLEAYHKAKMHELEEKDKCKKK